MDCHVYAWAKRRGYFGRSKDRAISHLLLDKGVLCVPIEYEHDFLHEYSIGVVSSGRPPCIVEYKSQVFKMFYDLDIVTTPEMASDLSAGCFDNIRPFLDFLISPTLFKITSTVKHI